MPGLHAVACITRIGQVLSRMQETRRSFIALLAVMPLGACASGLSSIQQGAQEMYGLIGKMRAVEGQRDQLAAILLEGLRDMPGNLSYIVSKDPEQADTLWITEVWTDSEVHASSLSLPSVQQAIAKGRPLIAGMERVAETMPIGGHGLSPAAID